MFSNMDIIKINFKKYLFPAGHRWLTPVILATQKTKIRRVVFQSQLGQKVHETLFLKKKPSQKRTGGVAHI
jgi:hypothetical protein